jgi:hypothetical protein
MQEACKRGAVICKDLNANGTDLLWCLWEGLDAQPKEAKNGTSETK